MKKILLYLIPFILAQDGIAQEKTIGRIISLDPAFDKLVDKDAKIEVLGEGYKWSEGPVWVKRGQYLLFSDVPANTVYRWKEGEGMTEFLKPSGYTGRLPYGNEPGSNGLIINKAGELVSCEHGDRRISAMPLEGGGKRTLTDNYNGKRYNSPNDIVQHPNGDYYFTDPTYGIPNDSMRQLKVKGVYRLSKNGKVELVISDLTPNGLAFSPDGKILYVGQSLPEQPVIFAYTMLPDGKPGKRKLFYDASALSKQKLPGLPDGMKTDVAGNLFTSGPGGILVISPSGKLLGRIEIMQPTANCAWGDDGSTLYITANMLLCRIRTKSKGANW